MRPLRPRLPRIVGLHFSVYVWLDTRSKDLTAKIEARADRYGLAGVDRRLLKPRFSTLVYTGSWWLDMSRGGLRYDILGRGLEDSTFHVIAPGLTRRGSEVPLGLHSLSEFCAERNARDDKHACLNAMNYAPSFNDGRLSFSPTEAWDPHTEATIAVAGEALGGLDLWLALEHVWRWTISDEPRPGYREALAWAPGFESSVMSGREDLRSSGMSLTFELEAIEGP